MKTLIHIGTEKTGSTSFQAWASMNRQELARHGFWYSKALGDVNHVKAYVYALPIDVHDEGFGRIGANSPEERLEFQEHLPGELAREYEQAQAKGCHTFIASTELCHSRLRTEDMVRKLHSLFAPLSEQINILCYLRPQIDMAVSLASTAARVRLRVDHGFFERINADDKYYNYHELYLRWRAVFGDDALTIVGFQKNADTVAHFCGMMGLDLSAFAPVPRLNEALDIQTIAMCNALADEGHLPGTPDFRMTRLPLEVLSCDERLQIGQDLAREIQSRFDESNQALLAARGELTLDDLTPKWSRYDKPSNLDVLEEHCAFGKKFAETVKLMNFHLIQSRIGQKIAQIERGIWSKNFAISHRLLHETQGLLNAWPSENADFSDERAQVERRLKKLKSNPDLARYIARQSEA